MKILCPSAVLLVLALSAKGGGDISHRTNATTAKATSTTAALIENARAVADGLNLQTADQSSIASLKPDEAKSALEIIDRTLQPHTLFRVNINPEMRVKVNQGGAPARLAPGEWTTFLARIENESGTTAPLQINVLPPANVPHPSVWIEAVVVDRTNLPVTLSGTPLEYRLVKLRGLEMGQREARLSLHVGQGTQDLGFRNEVDILFNCHSNLTVHDKLVR